MGNPYKNYSKDELEEIKRSVIKNHQTKIAFIIERKAEIERENKNAKRENLVDSAIALILDNRNKIQNLEINNDYEYQETEITLTFQGITKL